MLFHFCLLSTDCCLIQLTLVGGRGKDPLNGVGNVDLRVNLEKKTIVGIILLDECVLFSG